MGFGVDSEESIVWGGSGCRGGGKEWGDRKSPREKGESGWTLKSGPASHLRVGLIQGSVSSSVEWDENK